MGSVNYLQPFLLNIAAKTTFHGEQVSQWDWTPSTDSPFQQLKQGICNTLWKTTLAYYDRTQPLTIQTDAGEYGLGAALLQKNKPITFASKTLTCRNQICKCRMRLSFSSLQIRKIYHLHLQQTHHSIQ